MWRIDLADVVKIEMLNDSDYTYGSFYYDSGKFLSKKLVKCDKVSSPATSSTWRTSSPERNTAEMPYFSYFLHTHRRKHMVFAFAEKYLRKM